DHSQSLVAYGREAHRHIIFRPFTGPRLAACKGDRTEPPFAAMVDAVACCVVAARRVGDDSVSEQRLDLTGVDRRRSENAHPCCMPLRVSDSEPFAVRERFGGVEPIGAPANAQIFAPLS